MIILDKFKINGKLLKQLDYMILLVVVIIVLFGAINIFSATHVKYHYEFFRLQIGWLILGLLVVYTILLFDYSLIMNYASVIYWAMVALLVYNDITSKAINGASSWIKIGSRAIEPGEFAKLAMTLMLAKKLNDMEGNINNVKNFFVLMFYAVLPMTLIVIQPDMGLTMVSFFIALGIFYVSGLNLKVILGGLTSIVVLVAAVWNSPLMQDYWKKRLTSFLDPKQDIIGAGMQLWQSQIAIGSGGILGKGFMKGTQIAAGYVPEAHTDFIFAVVNEEWGMIGSLVLLILYGIILCRIIRIAKESKDVFGSVMCVGIASSLLFSVLQNMGMTIGIMPVSGITLPFMSYGGSSMLTNFIAIGIILNVGMRKKKINF